MYYEITERAAFKCKSCDARCQFLAQTETVTLRLFQATAVTGLQLLHWVLKSCMSLAQSVLDLTADVLCQTTINQSINQSTFVKRHKSRANRRRVKKKARPNGYRMLWQKVPPLKHVWKRSQFWLIDNYMAASSTLKASWDWKILPTSQETFEV